jgi:hypothetical protein
MKMFNITNHEVTDGPMKLDTIVITSLSQFQKIFAGLRQHVTIQFQVERSKIGNQSDIPCKSPLNKALK